MYVVLLKCIKFTIGETKIITITIEVINYVETEFNSAVKLNHESFIPLSILFHYVNANDAVIEWGISMY